jgi:hypothetical protein
MTKPLVIGLALAFGVWLQSEAHARSAALQCLADLDDAKAFISVNDAGADLMLADHGGAIAQAYEAARLGAAQAEDDETCFRLLENYLRAWRTGHLGVARTLQDTALGPAARPDAHAENDPRLPRLQSLDTKTLVLTLPSFLEPYGPVLRRFLDQQRPILESHRYWIIDVRDNEGGSDSTFEPLLPWLLDGEMRTQSVEYLATPANIKAQGDICGFVDDAATCREAMAPTVEAMKRVPAGTFVHIGAKVLVQHLESEPHHPERVVVLTDRSCASSCEQFVLEARGAPRVKILGRPTAGMLDVSNLRPHTLPSGRLLFYATTRSTRLPDMRIDGIGIAPDILLERPASDAERLREVKRARKWLEDGSLGVDPDEASRTSSRSR